MIERVWRQVAKVLGDAVVATDDSRILKEVERFGGRAVMTSESHRSGTDRCFEAYNRLGGNEDVIINIQGDEPFIKPEQIESLIKCCVAFKIVLHRVLEFFIAALVIC